MPKRREDYGPLLRARRASALAAVPRHGHPARLRYGGGTHHHAVRRLQVHNQLRGREATAICHCGVAYCIGCVRKIFPRVSKLLLLTVLISGISTIINVMRVPIPLTKKLFGKQLYIGSGLLSVMGTSFTFLPVGAHLELILTCCDSANFTVIWLLGCLSKIFEIAIREMMADGIEGTVAYGMMLGTCMVGSLIEIVISVLPGRYIRAIFPPVVCAVTVTLIGLALTGTGKSASRILIHSTEEFSAQTLQCLYLGMKYWGGGVVCAGKLFSSSRQILSSGRIICGLFRFQI